MFYARNFTLNKIIFLVQKSSFLNVICQRVDQGRQAILRQVVCLAAQKASRLPDFCNADAFTKRSIAFVLFIMPNLAQKYTQGEAADYIVEVMPSSMREAGKRVQHNCIANGTYHDLMNLTDQSLRGRGLRDAEADVLASQR